MTEEQRQEILEFIREKIEAQGMCHCNSIPVFMNKNEMPDWKTLRSPDEKLYNWIARVFPEYETRKKEDGTDFVIVSPGMITDTSKKEELPKQESGEEEGNHPNMEKRYARAMQDAVFSFAYVPPITTFTNMLRELCQDTSIKTETWKEACIQTLGEYLLGMREDVLDDSMAEPPRVAFPVDLENGKKIYGILGENTAGGKQHWRLYGFAIPGMRDEEGWGNWLCKTFDLPSEDRESYRVAMESITRQVEELKQMQPQVVDGLGEAANTVREGRMLPDALAALLQEYSSGWQQLKEAIREAYLDIPESEMNLGYLEGLANEESVVPLHLTEASELFADLAEHTWSFLKKMRLIPDNTEKMEADLLAWNTCMENRGSAESLRDALKEILHPYRTFYKLTQLSADEIYASRVSPELISEMESHFGASLNRRSLMDCFIFYREEDDPDVFVFLEGMSQIDRLLDYAESAEQPESPMQGKREVPVIVPKTSRELLERIHEGEYVCHEILSSFPRPDILEQAIMTGDAGKIEEEAAELPEEESAGLLEKIGLLEQIQGDLGPYSAGVRLSVTRGTRNGQAERCFLMAYAMGNMESVRWLYKIFSDDDRLEELRLLYQDCGENERVDEKTRSRMLERLLDAGLLDGKPIVTSDIVALLEPERIAAIAERDRVLAERLQGILNKMEEPFAAYAVTMSDKMRSYILEPENIEHLQSIGIQRSGDALLALVRSGNYARSRGALPTARRVYAFMGNWNHLAADMADMLPDGPDVNAFRLRLARDDDDREQMLRLMREDVSLQNRYANDYAALLFEAGDYAEYLDTAASEKDPLCTAVARLRSGEEVEVIPDQPEVSAERAAEVLPGLTDGEREILSRAAAAGGDAFLAYYLAAGEKEEFITGAENALMQMLQEIADLSVSKQEQLLQRFEGLCGDLYQTHQGDLFAIRLDGALTREEGASCAEAVRELLPQVTTSEAAKILIEKIRTSGRGRELCAYPAVYESVNQTLCALGMKEEAFVFLHENRAAKNPEFVSHLYHVYEKNLEEGVFPAEYMEEAEQFVLSHLRIEGSLEAACCAYYFERSRGRRPQMLFALRVLRNRMEEASSERREWIRDEISRFGYEAERNELSLFAEALGDPECEIADYLYYCRAFRCLTEEDESVVRGISYAYATESESDAILHVLYQNGQEESAWELAQKLPLRDRPSLYARLLYEAACRTKDSEETREDGEQNHTWKRCTEYCIENKLYDILLDALRRWAEDTTVRRQGVLPWYQVKGLFAAVGQLSTGELPEEWRAREGDIRELTDQMILLFQRFNSAGDGDANHNSLRIIIEFAVAADMEDCILENTVLMNSLYGPNRKLCFVLALRLIDRDRIGKAQELLRQLLFLDTGMPYAWLIRDYTEMGEEEIRAFRESGIGKDLRDLVLPDGNTVNGKKLRALVMKHLEAKTWKDGLATLDMLLRGGEDCMVYTAMFVLCKYRPMENIPRIYDALSGICRNYPLDPGGKDLSWIFSRKRQEILQLLLITRVVMEKNNIPVPAEDEELIHFLRDIFPLSTSAWTESEIGRFVNTQTAFYEKILRMYDGKNAGIMTEALMGQVTGNWVPILKTIRERKLSESSLHDVFALCGGRYAGISTYGLLRSVLLVMRESDEEGRRETVRWMMQCANLDKDAQLKRLYAIAREADNVNREDEAEKTDGTRLRYYDLNVVDERFLMLPMEEHFVCLGDWADLGDEEILSCFHWMKVHTPTSRLRTTANLFARLAQDVSAGMNLSRYAQELFNQNADEQAAIFYDVLNLASRQRDSSRQIFGKSIRQCTEEDKKFWKELYQCRARISGAFSGNEAIIAKLKKIRPRSAYNLVMTLLTSRRRGEVHRLAGFLRGINRTMALDLLQLVSPAADDEEKLRIREKYFRNNEGYEGITFLLSRTTRSERFFYTGQRTELSAEKPLFLSSLESARELERDYQTLMKRRYTPETRPFYIAPEFPVSVEQLIQQDPAPAEEEAERKDGQVFRASLALPDFAEEIRGELAGSSLPERAELEALYEKLEIQDYRKRMEISGQCFALVGSNPETTRKDLFAALIRCGLDYYTYHRSEDPGANAALADRAIREMAIWCGDREAEEEQLRNLTEKIPIALLRILNGYADADQLVEDWQRNQEGYSAMIRLVSNLYPFLSPMQSTLRNLCRACQNIGGGKQGNEPQYKTAYAQCIDQLVLVSIDRRYGGEWLEAKSRLIKLLQEAQNAVDQRPDLSIQILNTEGMRKDAVFGELMNTGREPAENIAIFMFWSDDQEIRTSPKYTCASLRPGERVAFAIDYEVKEGVNQFSYTLTVTAEGHGVEMNIPSEKGVIRIIRRQDTSFPTDLYQSDRPVEFEYRDGLIMSPAFFGRESQMEELRRCVEGHTIQENKNRVVQGVRRSGKTSLLNYLKKYCEVFCPHIIPVYEDCQGITHHPIQTIFIKSVLDILPVEIPGLRGWEDWEMFREEWSLSREEEDREQQEITDFYQALYRLLDAPRTREITGRSGILLIIDEFDVLLQNLGDKMADDLLQTLRKVMGQCGNVVKLIFCGSNNLILYKMNGGRYNQFFQSVDVIVVDDLPMKDLEEMLRKPYEGTGVQIPDETMHWVYRYTGGLVWYTKLLGKAMLQRTKDAGRNVVYPTDVYAAFTTICNDGNCQQFFEGCGDEEHRVLSAMAELSPRYQTRVTIEDLREKIGSDLTALRLNSALTRLRELRLLEETSGRYMFRKEIYRRYFRTRLTIGGGGAADVLEKAAPAERAGAFGMFSRRG